MRIVIPTRDSSSWVGVLFEEYRSLGENPLYVVDARSTDGTGDLLRSLGADVVDFSPNADYVEAGMIRYAAEQANCDWILRMDDDEFPSKVLLAWARKTGVKTIKAGWFISRFDLFFHDGTVWISRRPGRYQVQSYYSNLVSPQPRLFNRKRVKYSERVHTSGFESVFDFNYAPPSVFFAHFDRLLRSPCERYEKIKRYEAVEPGCAWRLADEYLPEFFEFVSHNPRRWGLSEFDSLIKKLPLSDDFTLPAIPQAELDFMYDEVKRFFLHCIGESRENFEPTPQNNLEWLRFFPRKSWGAIADFLCTFGFFGWKKIGVEVWNYNKNVDPR